MDPCMIKDNKFWKSLEKTLLRALRCTQGDNIKICLTELGYERG